ncbi:MAG: 50S ribosomal protein L10 [Candidatus Omnitrophica bacterium]|nr:50S ribosomal protein L10 [Candidatus Omnitrophota bacterium]
MVEANKTIEKEMLLKQLLETAQTSDYIFFAKFKGLTVNDLNSLRRKLEKVADDVLVVKNSIARMVLERINAKAACDFLEGSVLLTTGKRDPQIVSKVLVEFAKERENFELKGAFVNQTIFQKQFIQDLAKLPLKQELIASVVGGFKAPITGFVLGLGQIVRSLVAALDQIQKKKSS